MHGKSNIKTEFYVDSYSSHGLSSKCGIIADCRKKKISKKGMCNQTLKIKRNG